MSAEKIKAFFSCSFNPKDEEVNSIFLAVCDALSIACTNVSSGSVVSPPDVALKKVAQCDLFVAVCTRRDQLVSGGFTMPVAVRNEIGIAYGKELPIVLFVEEGVDIAGFESNIGTYQKFDREKLGEIATVGKIVQTLHDSRALISKGLIPYAPQGRDDAHCERIDYAVSLEIKPAVSWSCDVTKKLIYNKKSKRPIPTSFWAAIPECVPMGAGPIEFDVVTDESSRSIEMAAKIDRRLPHVVEASLTPRPTPGAGDYVEYTVSAKSPYLNRVWLGGDDAQCTQLGDDEFQVVDGILTVHKTDLMIAEFKFPRAYGLKEGDLKAFVASYTSGFDYELESEVERSKITVKAVGKNLVAKLEVERPLLHHMYGFAWNPPADPEENASKGPQGNTSREAEEDEASNVTLDPGASY